MIRKTSCSIGGIGIAAVAAPAFASDILTTLVSFDGSNGAYPNAGVTLSGSTLYGTTGIGGNLSLNGGNGYGTVFSVPVTGGTPTTLASFNSTNGRTPDGNLILADSTLYGTTLGGGAGGYGTVFSVPVTAGAPTTLVSFNYTDGWQPYDGLTLSGNILYGTTNGGGAHYGGTAFSVPVTGGTPTTLVTFNGTNGANPFAGLTLSGSTLYGTTAYGGNLSLAGGFGDGTVFAVTIPEPAALAMMAIAGAGILLVKRKKKSGLHQ